MNLGLVSCRSPFLDDSKVYPPLGLLYLKSSLEEQMGDASVRLIDDYSLDRDSTDFFGLDAVGISVMTPQRDEAQKVIDFIRNRHPHLRIIGGGPHIKHYLEGAKKMGFDTLVTDDGERVLPGILRGEITDYVVTDKLSAKELASMPRPDRTSPDAIELLNGYTYNLEGRDSTTILYGRGCPEQCTFCEDAQTNIRWTPVGKAEQELDDIVELGYGGVYIFDDLFAIAEKMVRPLAGLMAERDLVYRCNAQARYFTRDGDSFAKLLAETGCAEIAFGAESGSQEILDNIKKRTTVQSNYDTVKFAKEHGIKVKAFLMLGLPGETRETIAATEKFIAESGIDDFQLSIYYPYKGTAIRDQIDKGEKPEDITFEGEGLGAYGQTGGSTESVVRTGALSSAELLEHRDRIVRDFKPKSHEQKWKEDSFFDTHLISEPEEGFKV